MDDALKPFYTGWNTGSELAQQDNARYTQFGNQTLQNTGMQNREMLGHLNKLQNMALTGYDEAGRPLLPEQHRSIMDIVNKLQPQFTQGVYTPADYLSPYTSAPVGMPTAPVPKGTNLELPNMVGPMKPSSVQLPQMQQAQTAPAMLQIPQMPPPEPQTTPQLMMQGPAAPVAPRPQKTTTAAPVKKRRPIQKTNTGIMTNSGIQPITKWNPIF